MKTLILLIALLIPQTVTDLDGSFLFHIDLSEPELSEPSYNPNECTRWCWEPPSLMIDWSIVADEIRNRNLIN